MRFDTFIRREETILGGHTPLMQEKEIWVGELIIFSFQNH